MRPQIAMCIVQYVCVRTRLRVFLQVNTSPAVQTIPAHLDEGDYGILHPLPQVIWRIVLVYRFLMNR